MWFPLASECLCDSNAPEEATVPSGNSEVTEHESRVPEIDDRQQAILVIPEPSRRNSSAAANSHLEQDGTSSAPEAGE